MEIFRGKFDILVASYATWTSRSCLLSFVGSASDLSNPYRCHADADCCHTEDIHTTNLAKPPEPWGKRIEIEKKNCSTLMEHQTWTLIESLMRSVRISRKAQYIN
jgi:hypothetical protein